MYVSVHWWDESSQELTNTCSQSIKNNYWHIKSVQIYLYDCFPNIQKLTQVFYQNILGQLYKWQDFSIEIKPRGWRDGSEVGSTVCPSRGPRFNSQHPHGSSQLSVNPVPGSLTPSHRHTYRNTNAHKIKINKSFLKKESKSKETVTRITKV